MAMLLKGTEQVLLDQIDRTISMYQWTVGIFISIILAAVGFFSYIQWKMKKDQEQKIKKEILTDVSNDITKVLEPLISNSLEQTTIIGHPNYKKNIETLKSFLELDSKYAFSENLSKQLLSWKYKISKDFKLRFEGALDLPIYDSEASQRLDTLFATSIDVNRLPELEKISQIISPVAEKREASGIRNYEDVNEMLQDYKMFYDKFKDL